MPSIQSSLNALTCGISSCIASGLRRTLSSRHASTPAAPAYDKASAGGYDDSDSNFSQIATPVRMLTGRFSVTLDEVSATQEERFSQRQRSCQTTPGFQEVRRVEPTTSPMGIKPGFGRQGSSNHVGNYVGNFEINAGYGNVMVAQAAIDDVRIKEEDLDVKVPIKKEPDCGSGDEKPSRRPREKSQTVGREATPHQPGPSHSRSGHSELEAPRTPRAKSHTIGRDSTPTEAGSNCHTSVVHSPQIPATRQIHHPPQASVTPSPQVHQQPQTPVTPPSPSRQRVRIARIDMPFTSLRELWEAPLDEQGRRRLPNVGMPCLECDDPMILDITGEDNTKGNAGRPYYACKKEGDGKRHSFTFADMEGVASTNRPCLCNRPSRGTVAGPTAPKAPGKPFWSCAECRCRFKKWE